MQIKLANPRGFCAGVDRAIAIVERTLDTFGAPVYVRHEVVHNRYVVERLRDKGAVFVENIAQVPAHSTVVFSAHGVSQQVRREARARQLRIFDATCPLVTKVHIEVQKYAVEGIDCVLIGHAGHPEVEGTMGQLESTEKSQIYLVENLAAVDTLSVRNPLKLAYVTQTTLSVDDTTCIIAALRARFPDIRGPRKKDICYATQNRQDAVRALAEVCDTVLVVGSLNSSNSNRLCELAQRMGRPSYLIDDPQQIQPTWLLHTKILGVTAGASAPETLVQEIVDFLHHRFGAEAPEELAGRPEGIIFPLPKSLR